MITQIQRDGFARTSLMRQLLSKVDRGGCRWCGNAAKYSYAWVGDAQSPLSATVKYSGPFCTVSCFRSYHA